MNNSKMFAAILFIEIAKIEMVKYSIIINVPYFY